MSKPANSNESPLLDKSILLTRPEGQSEATRLTLESLGASVNAHPVIQILPPKDFTELDDCLDRLDQFDWLVLVSPNAVRFFCQRFGDKFKTFAPLHQKKIATIGSTTLEALKLEATGIPIRLAKFWQNPESNSNNRSLIDTRLSNQPIQKLPKSWLKANSIGSPSPALRSPMPPSNYLATRF